MGFSVITWRELDRLLESNKKIAVIDLRKPEYYAKERILGSISLPFEELEERLDEVPKDCPDLFYCDWGSKSMLVCRSLARMGYTCASLASGFRNYRGKFIDRNPR